MDISRIGIGITTRNRPEVLKYTIGQFFRFTPSEIDIVVVDDNSIEQTDVDGCTYHYNTERLGVAKSKNECIKLLDKDFVFLFDDDCFPTANKWWESWIDAGENHMVMSPGKVIREKKDNCRHMDGGLGCCIFLTRKAIETVGGFDPDFGMWVFEHAELSNRIFMAGLTDWVYIAPLEEHIYSFDYSGSTDDFEWEERS